MREVSAYLLTIEPSAKSSGASGQGLERKRPRLLFCARSQAATGDGCAPVRNRLFANPLQSNVRPPPPSKFSQLSAPPRRMETLFAA